MKHPKKTLNDQFTDFADMISEGMGQWWVSVVSAILIIGWTLYCIGTQGPGWWYGTFYNLPLNLVTTVIELFVGFLIAAAANRVEKRNKELQEIQVSILKHIEQIAGGEDEEIKQIEQEVKQEEKTQMLVGHLDRQDTELVKQTKILMELLQKITEKP